jgi:chromosome segregation ATPase
MKPTQNEVDDMLNKADQLHADADELEARAERLQAEVESNRHWEKTADRVAGYSEWIQEIRGHADIPQFQKNLIEEKLESTTLKGSDLRLAYQSGGMMPPTDLIGLP